jgi:7-cyano-7-deazaguanine synthase in queuosine biosynthesis
MYSSVVLYSGGIDSIVTLEFVRRCLDVNTQPVYFNIQSKYGREECGTVMENESNVIVDDSIKLGDIEQSSAFIPNRNILLATMAVSKYSKTVYIGGSLSDRVSDNNKECFDELSRFLTSIDGKEVVKITSPFWNYYKDDMVEWFINNKKNGRDYLYSKSFSCYSPVKMREIPVSSDKGKLPIFDWTTLTADNHCFNCKACLRRNVHLMNCGYLLPFYDDNIIDHYLEEFDLAINKNLARIENTRLYAKRLKTWRENVKQKDWDNGRN